MPTDDSRHFDPDQIRIKDAKIVLETFDYMWIIDFNTPLSRELKIALMELLNGQGFEEAKKTVLRYKKKKIKEHLIAGVVGA